MCYVYGRKQNLGYMAKVHVHNSPFVCLQPRIFGILLGMKCRMVRDCAREVKPGTGKLYACLCGSANSRGCMVDGLSATARHSLLL